MDFSFILYITPLSPFSLTLTLQCAQNGLQHTRHFGFEIGSNETRDSCSSEYEGATHFGTRVLTFRQHLLPPSTTQMVAGSSELLAIVYQITSAPYTSKLYSSKIFTQDRHQKPTENSATYFACKKYQCGHAYRW